MKIAKTISRSFAFFGALTLICLAVLAQGCGGGGGGGGGGTSASDPGGGEGITLMSITFPTSTNLTGGTTVPPDGAPLGQQVIFTFSDIPEGPDQVIIDLPPGYDAIQIYAVVGDNYLGPEVVVERDKNTIPARGIFEKLGNMIVFTPFFPTEPIDLSSGAQKESIPGLLPDLEYIIYVPLGIGGSITNLTRIDPAVSNPVLFTTCAENLPNFYYQNHPVEIPRIVAQYPGDGEVDVPINTYTGQVPGFPVQQEFYLEFDQPLFFSDENIVGEDLDGDGENNENMYFTYASPVVYAALDFGTSLDPSIVSVNRETGEVTVVGTTKQSVNPFPVTGLNSIVVTKAGQMLGSSGTTLYGVEYRFLTFPDICPLYFPRDLDGRTDVRCLAFAPNGTLHAIDAATGSLITIDHTDGTTAVRLELGTAAGDWKDLAICADGTLYAAAVSDSGQPAAFTTVQEIDLDDDTVATIFAENGDYTSISMTGFSRLAMYSGPGLFVDVLDLETGLLLPGERYEISAGLEDGALLNIDAAMIVLGTWADLSVNTYKGSRVILKPSGILPFGERIELLVRRGLDNIHLGSVAALEDQDPAEADRFATFWTFDPGGGAVDDIFYEDFLDTEWKGDAQQEGMAPANWPVQDVDQIHPQYEHLLATYGQGGGGGLGDFMPLGVYPTVLLDTDYQVLPLYDGSTPGVKKRTVIEGGVFNFHDIIIPSGVTVRGMGSNPLILTATGRVEIEGTIDVSGDRGMDDITFNSAFTPVPGGIGGPGGGRGGMAHPTHPPYFQFLTDLRSPEAGEDGWDYSNLRQAGGRGGHSGAKGTDVRYAGSSPDDDSRGAGGGGGSFYQEGRYGFHGKGRWGADPYSPDRYYERDSWVFDDGAPDGTPGQHNYITTDPPGGDAGDRPFEDLNPLNDFIGQEGELKFLRGGQGGGGGGTRLDSMNPITIGLAANWFPPLDRSAYDSKGGGGGGGGGALAIYALGEIFIRGTGEILANGGDGGGGEVIGHANFGGGGGGGSGGAVILDSADKIRLELGSIINVSGGWLGDAQETTWTPYSNQNWTAWKTNKCLDPSDAHRKNFCCWSVGDGGAGGFGLIQLQVPLWDQGDLIVQDWGSVYADLCEVDWKGQLWGMYALCDGGGDNCKCNPPNNCEEKWYHYKVQYPGPYFPRAEPNPAQDRWWPMIDPEKTPSTLGPLSYGLSKWIDLGQIVHRDPVGLLPAPAFTGFDGIDTNTGVVITQNGYIPDPGSNDIEVYAPDWNNGTAHYIPDQNEVTVFFQGTDPVAPGSKVPDLENKTDWTADIQSLSGYQFIRFRVRLNTAKEPYQLTPTSPKPQVNFVRIRMQY